MDEKNTRQKENLNLAFQLLKKEGYTDIGKDENEFAGMMQQEDNRKLAYDLLKKAGYTDIGDDFNSFNEMIFSAPEEEKPVVQTQPAAPAQAETKQETTPSPIPHYQPKEFSPAAMQEDLKSQFNINLPGQDRPQVKIPEAIPGYTPAAPAKSEKQIAEEGTREQVNDMYSAIDEQLNAAMNQSMAEYQQREEESKKQPFLMRLAKSIGENYAPHGDVSIPMMRQYKEQMEGGFSGELHDRIQNLKAAKNSITDAKRMIEEADKAVNEGNFEGFFKGAARGFGQNLFDVRTWDMGLSDMENGAAFLSALDKFDKGKPLTESEQLMLDAKSVELATNAYFGSYIGRGYKAGSVTAESIPFMLEMCINPASGVGEAATSKLTRYALQRYGKKAIRDNAKKYVAGKVATRVVGDIAGAAIMAGTTGAVGVAADAEERMAGLNGGSFTTDEEGHSFFNGYREGEELAPALAKAFGARTIENHSELLGEYFAPVLGVAGKGVSKGLDKMGLGKVNNFINDVRMSDVGKLVADFEKHSHWDGVIGEFAEEIAGGVENSLIVGDQTLDTNPETGVFNPSQMLDTFLGVSLMGGFISSVKTAGYRTPKYRAKQAMNKAEAVGQSILGDEKWASFRTDIDNAVSPDEYETIINFYADDDARKKTAITDYLGKAMTYQGAVKGDEKRKNEGEMDPVQFGAEAAYENGYELQEALDMHDAQNYYAYQKQRLSETLGFDDIDISSLLFGADVAEIPEEQKQVAIDYINAKATYEGMIQRVKDDIESKVSAAHAAIDANTNVDSGRIQPATMKTDDRKVYVVGGYIGRNADGTVDKEKTQGSIIIKDAETGKVEFADPSAILTLDEEIDPVDEKNSVQEQIRQSVAQAAADKIDGKLPFAANDRYTLTNDKGMQFDVQIVANEMGLTDNGDGTVNVVLNPDGQGPLTVSQMNKDEIQQLYEATQLARLNQYEQQKVQQQAAIAENEAQAEKDAVQYQMEDTVTLRTSDGSSVRGSIVSMPDEDGKYEVYTEQPFNGKKINLFTKDEIDSFLIEHNGEPVQMPVVEQVAAEAAPEAQVQEPVQEQEQDTRTALERIPVDESGMQQFEKAPAKDTWEALVEMNEGNKDEAMDTAVQMSENANKELEKVLKQKAKGGSTVFEIQQNKAALKAAVKAAQAKADYWDAIVHYEENQRRMLEEEAKRQKRLRLAEARRIHQKEGRYKEENAALGEYIGFRDYILRMVSTGAVKFKWKGDPNTPSIKGLAQHLGFTGQNGEMLRRGWMLSNETGQYPEQAAEDLLVGYAEEMGVDIENTGFDSMDALSELLDVLLSYDNSRTMFEAAQALHGMDEQHIADAEAEYMRQEEERAAEQQAREQEQEEAPLMARRQMEQQVVADLRESGADDEEISTILNASDEELQNLIALREQWATVNDVLGAAHEKYGKDLKSKDAAVKKAAEEIINKAQADADTAFEPVQRLYDSLMSKYGQEQTEAGEQQSAIDAARAEVNTDPTEGQKKAGNYKMGHIVIDGHNISLENPKGSVRKGVDGNGKEWQTEMKNDYGYIRMTEGVDGDHIDVFLSDTPEQGNVYVVDQVNPKDGSFDEHKVMYGFNSVDEAKAAYLANYEEGWQGLGNITPVSKEEFKKWIDSSHRKTKPFAEYASVKPLQDNSPEIEGIETESSKNVNKSTNNVDSAKTESVKAGDTVLYKGKEMQVAEVHENGNVDLVYDPTGYLPVYSNGIAQSEIKPVSKTDESVPKEAVSVPKTGESVPESTESVPKEPESVSETPTLGTVTKSKHTKTGEDIWIVNPADRLSSDDFKALRESAKEHGGYYSKFKENRGFIFKTEEDANAFNTENADKHSTPVSLSGIKEVVGGSFDTVEAKPQEEEAKNTPKWQYNLYVSKDGRSVITRDDMSGIYPIGDGRFRIEAKSPAELKSILQSNGLTDILSDIEATIDMKIRHFEFRKKADTEGFNGYKIGDRIIYAPNSKDEYPGTVKDFDEYGEHLPVIDTGLAPVMYEVAHLDQIRHAETQQEQPKQEEKPVNPSGNKLVTDERYAELRRRMMDKLKGQMNMGIDPEILAIGTEMAVYHIEKGARKFAEFAKAMIADLSDAIRPYLKAFYNGARDLPEMSELSKEMTPYDEVSNFDVANFDKATVNAMAAAEATVKEQEVERQAEQATSKLRDLTTKKEETQKNEEKSVSSQAEIVSNEEKTARRAFSSAIATDMLAALETGERPYKSIVNLREKARQAGMQVDDEGRDDILIQELVEDGLVKAARFVVSQGLYGGSKSKECFSAICKLYEMQPTIASRSSNRIKMQQYSTPLPMGFVADMFAYYKGKTHTVLEPTAGNGMLVFAVPAQAVHANELDKTRLENLMLQGFGLVTSQDATLPIRDGQRIYDAVIANPPFGAAEAKVYDGKEISGLDPQITLNALSNMKDDGKAAIIIGGNLEYGPNGAIKGKKSFITYLYDHYNVKGIVDMEGQLYQRQGTTYPTMMILIDGRRTEEERAQTAVYPPVKANAVRKAETFDDLYDIVTEIISSTDKTNGTEILRSQQGQLLSDIDNAPRNADGTRHTEKPRKDGKSGRGQRTASDGTLDLFGESGQDNGVSQSGNGPDTGRGSEKPVGGLGGNAAAPVAGNIPSENGVGLKAENKPETTPQEKPVQAPVRKEQKPQEKRDLNTEKLPYRPHNTAFSLESVAPAAMVEAMDRTLSAIEEEHGSIDEFVRSELGYDTIDDAHNALAAEQMDAVAMAIVQMKKGEALIIGDQTGVGKGRQMASLIRWAVRQGQKPIFITQKADLFSDLYRDMVDVGIGDLRPFIFNSDGAIVDQNKKGKDGKPLVIHKPASSSEQAKVFASGQLPDEYDFAVLTYSQVNTGDAISQQEAEAVAKENAKETGSRSFGSKKSKSVKNAKPTPKATFLRALAEDNYLLLDESHTAAGSSNTGMYLQSILKTARAATFASATFAKRPDTMPLYAIRTAMSKAKVKINELITIIENGGVTLQEIMSRALTEAGQMVRRERDMSDVVTDWKTITDPATVQRARENYDKTIEAFNDIIKFQQDYVKPRIDDLSASLAVTASSANVKKGTDKMGVENVPFASKTYNYTKQLMLALKVDAIADEVEAQIKAGLHPVIALESTMESSIKDYSPGEVIPEPTFSASLLKGLDSCMQYTVKDDEGKETHRTFSPQSLGPDAEQAYYELRDKIREATSDIFISPLDAIISKLEAKGYKVGELTGRNSVVEIDDKGRAVVKKRTDKDKKLMQAQFNDGTLDVLILNKSASTGISLHASKKFKDQRQRAMIIAQPLSDINDYMQMIGRIDRTGQVHRGYYINLGLPVPAEQRFLMMLATKLKSLNANTTTAQESESNNVDAPDLLNKYGSQVVIEYLRDNPEIYTKMGEPLKKRGNGTTATVHANELDEYKPDEEDARKITGYVALLNTNEQEAFYNEVVKRYVDLITYLNDIGENDLKITVMPLRAQTLSKKVSSEGMDPNGENPFAQHAYVEEVEMDVLREPMKADEIRKLIDNLYGEIPEEEKGKPFRERFARMQTLRSRIEAETETKLQKEEARYEAAKARSADDIARNTERVNRNQKLSDEDKARAIASYIEDTNEKIETQHQENVEKIHRVQESFIRRVGMFHPGETYIIPDQLETPSIAFFSHAIFCGLKTGDKKMTPSTTTAIFATNDARRKVEVKLSQFSIINNIHDLTMQNFGQTQEVNLDNWDAQRPNDRRKKGFIMTGNILQAIADTKDKNGNYQGQLISFTDIDDNVRDGILMPDKWNPTQLTTSGVPILARLQEIRSGRLVTSIDNAVTIQGGYQNIFYTLRVPKTKAAGGFIFQNDEIVNLTNGGSGFYQSRGQLQADIPSDNIDELVRLLSNLGVKVEGKNEAKQDANRYRSAYHGTGADFEAFDLAHAGEGEGAQAHGYGVYVAFDKEVGKGYAVKIAGNKVVWDGLESYTSSHQVAESVINSDYNGNVMLAKKSLALAWPAYMRPEYAKIIINSDIEDWKVNENARNLYAVEIPENDGTNYIDEQKKVGKRILKRVSDGLKEQGFNIDAYELYKIINQQSTTVEGGLGLDLYDYLSSPTCLNGKKNASDFLSSIGIVGILYDGRRDGECAVIFNTSDISITNHERFRIREKDAPEKTGIGYKVFVVKNGRLYPPMVANPNGASTPTGVWLDADAAPISGQSKTGRPQVKAGGKGTQGGSGQLAYRPGWHLGEIPYALQFNRKGDLFPKNFVWAEVEYAADRNYQQEAEAEGMTENGKYRHSYAGLKHLPEDGFYTYRTNPNPETDPWIITGAMRVKRILKPSEVDELVRKADRLPQKREQGAFTDEQIDALNAEIESRGNTDYDAMEAKAKEFAGVLGVKVRTVRDLYDITDENRAKQSRMRSSKGWYDTETGEITVVVPNNDSVADVEATILHEIVGHKGMRQIVGEKNYNDFLDKVYAAADKNLRERITDLAKKHGWDFRLATEEYIAELSEEGFNGRLERNLLEKIRDLVVDMFRRAKIAIGFHINDNDLRYMLWRSYRNRAKGAMGTAEDVVMQTRLGVGNYRNLYNFANNDRRRNQKNDDDRSERKDGTRVAGDNAKRLGAKLTLGDTGVFEEELAARRSRYSEADGSNHIEEQIGASFIDVAKRTGRFIPWEEAVSSGIKLNGNTKESICFVSDDHKKITKLKDPYAARATKGNSPFDIIEELLVHNELFPETAYRLVGITQDRLGDMRFVLEQDFVKYESFADENDIAAHLQKLGLKDEGRFIFGDERCAVLDAYGENVLVDENGTLRFIDPIIKIKQQPGDNLRYRSGDARSQYEAKERRVNKEGRKTDTANLLHRLHEAYQDSMLALKELQKAISKETGNDIEDNENAYMAENAMSSKNKAQVDIYDQKFYSPLKQQIRHLLKDGAKYEDIIRYLIAKHGLERNIAFSKREAEKDGGVWDGTVSRDFSGLTDLTGSVDDFTGEAETIVSDFEAAHDTAPLWDSINKATKETLRTNYVSGLMDKATYDKVRTMFDYYIPLRGWNEDVAANEYEYLLSGKSLVSPTLKKAEGRKSIADDPIATIGHMAGSAIVMGNRNLMKQKFLNFVLNNPTNLATVSEQWYVLDPATKEWNPRNPVIPVDATPEQVADIVNQFEEDMKAAQEAGNATRKRSGLNIGLHTTIYEGQEHCVRVKRAGKEYCIYVNGNPRAAQAINGLTNPDASKGWVTEKAKAIKNFMARMFTSQNPAFIITNLSRDVIWAGTAVAIKEDAAYNAQYQKNILSSLAKGKLISLVHKFNNGTLDDSVEVEKYFAEFIKNGGETGFTQLNTVENFKRDMKRFVKEIDRGGIAVPAKVWRGIWDGVEFMNRCAEDTTRFMVYMTSRQQGRTVQRSVYDAKEITVNFNKKGSGGYFDQSMNYLYIFFNATVQSLANVAKLAANNPGKTAAAFGTFGTLGFITPLLALATHAAFGGGDGDDDDSYWDLPEWVRRNNLVFFIPWTENGYITIPLPHELRPFYGIGEIALSCALGKEDVENGLKKGAEGFTSMLPLDYTANAGNTLVNLTPTIGQPVAQLIANVDYFGKPIYKRNDFNKLNPEWTKAYKGTNAWVVNGTKWLNEVTGGNNVKKGFIDLNPAVIEHLYESYLGGVGKTINRAAKTVSMIWDEDMRQWRNVPVASSFIQEADERTNGSQLNREYYNYLDEHNEVEHELSGYKSQLRMGAMEYADIIGKFVETPEFQRYKKLHGYVEAVSKMNAALKYADDTRREELEDRMRELKQQLVKELHEEEGNK